MLLGGYTQRIGKKSQIQYWYIYIWYFSCGVFLLQPLAINCLFGNCPIYFLPCVRFVCEFKTRIVHGYDNPLVWLCFQCHVSHAIYQMKGFFDKTEVQNQNNTSCMKSKLRCTMRPFPPLASTADPCDELWISKSTTWRDSWLPRNGPCLNQVTRNECCLAMMMMMVMILMMMMMMIS